MEVIKQTARSLWQQSSPANLRVISSYLNPVNLAQSGQALPNPSSYLGIVSGWITANPWKTASYAGSGILMATPAAVVTPVLAAVGFGSLGPIAGSVAATVQSTIGGGVAAHSTFAFLQSTAMGGYGVTAVHGVVQGGGVALGVATTAVSRWFR